MSKMFQCYGIGQALIPVLPPPLPFTTAPTSNQTNYEIGQLVFTPPTSPTAFYVYGGAGNWIQFASNLGDIVAINGTANQVTVTTAAGVATVSLPSAITTPGSLTTTTSLSATTTVTAGTGITATSGNIAASSGNVTASGSVTGGTGVTATTGAVTATNGNLVLGTAGNKIISTSVGTTTAAGANSFGTVALVSGTATVATTAVTANSIIQLTRQVAAGTSGTGAIGMLSVGTITAGVSFVINALTTANLSTLVTNDISTVSWEIIN